MNPRKQISPDIRLIAKPEFEDYESLFGKITDPVERKETYDLIERSGMWIVTAQFKCPRCEAWTDADSIGAIIGDPMSEQDNCYIPDLVAEAKSKLESIRSKFSI